MGQSRTGPPARGAAVPPEQASPSAGPLATKAAQAGSLSEEQVIKHKGEALPLYHRFKTSVQTEHPLCQGRDLN